MLKYAVVEVFRCAEEIISQNRRSVVDYAIVHRDLGRHSRSNTAALNPLTSSMIRSVHDLFLLGEGGASACWSPRS
jgi:hypothetical protein